jgi:hypothetical protein
MAVCSLVAACTPEPAPTVTPSPTPASVTPTETEIERQQRLDYEAAEKAYRRAVTESDRLAQQGSAETTSELEAVTTGAYLELQIDSLRYLKDRDLRQRGSVSIIKVSRDGGWSSDELNLIACEDNSSWRVFNKAGKDVTPSDQPDYVQSLVVVQTKDGWKVSDATSKKVDNVRAEDCER